MALRVELFEQKFARVSITKECRDSERDIVVEKGLSEEEWSQR